MVEEFASYSVWEDKYRHLIRIGMSLPKMEEKDKTPENKIKGCQSNVWLKTRLDGRRIWFMADSDSAIVKGLIALLVRVFSGQTPEAILAAKLQFFDEIEMRKHLSSTRSNGLAAMVKQIRLYALAYKTKTQAGI